MPVGTTCDCMVCLVWSHKFHVAMVMKQYKRSGYSYKFGLTKVRGTEGEGSAPPVHGYHASKQSSVLYNYEVCCPWLLEIGCGLEYTTQIQALW